jgi:hypothetical protein
VGKKPDLKAEQRAMALRLHAKGLNFKEIGEQIEASAQGARIAVVAAVTREAKPLAWSPGPGRLTIEEREEISLGLHRDASFSSIAARLGRSLSRSLGKWPPTEGAAAIALGGPISGPINAHAAPKRTSWPDPSWPPRSQNG